MHKMITIDNPAGNMIVLLWDNLTDNPAGYE